MRICEKQPILSLGNEYMLRFEALYPPDLKPDFNLAAECVKEFFHVNVENNTHVPHDKYKPTLSVKYTYIHINIYDIYIYTYMYVRTRSNSLKSLKPWLSSSTSEFGIMGDVTTSTLH